MSSLTEDGYGCTASLYRLPVYGLPGPWISCKDTPTLPTVSGLDSSLMLFLKQTITAHVPSSAVERGIKKGSKEIVGLLADTETFKLNRSETQEATPGRTFFVSLSKGQSTLLHQTFLVAQPCFVSYAMESSNSSILPFPHGCKDHEMNDIYHLGGWQSFHPSWNGQPIGYLLVSGFVHWGGCECDANA